MPTFIPPTVAEGPAGLGPLFSRYRLTRGETVIQNGSTYTTVRFPSQADLAAATNYWLGGHVYIVDAPTAAALIDAGYANYVTNSDVFTNLFTEVFE